MDLSKIGIYEVDGERVAFKPTDLEIRAGEPTRMTGISKMTGKNVVVEYINTKGENVYVNEDYLKKFGKRDDLLLKSESPKSVIHVYEKNSPFLIGYIMPVVKVNTNEKE
jgi:hypothetical protein